MLPPEGGGGGKCQIDHRSGPGRRTRPGVADPSRLTSDPVLRWTAGVGSSSHFRTSMSGRMGHKPIEPRVGRWSPPRRRTTVAFHTSRLSPIRASVRCQWSGGPVWAPEPSGTPDDYCVLSQKPVSRIRPSKRDRYVTWSHATRGRCVARPEAGRSSLATRPVRPGESRAGRGPGGRRLAVRFVYSSMWSMPCFETLPRVISPSIQPGVSSGAVSTHAQPS
ncbi:MAG: hypothetical protein A07HB70_01076 [uncultured archaeon A07HB70]|nr:MAG: hypothetical protein A07HB70_01076 [uncultured archaeon A07HB70]